MQAHVFSALRSALARLRAALTFWLDGAPQDATQRQKLKNCRGPALNYPRRHKGKITGL